MLENQELNRQQNEPAFPLIESGEKTDVWSAGGLTKREYFAAMALQSLDVGYGIENTAKAAVQLADALIAELNK